MRRFAAFLLLAAGAGLVLDPSLIRADDDEATPVTENEVEKADDDAPAPGKGKREKRGRRGRGGPGDGDRGDRRRGERGPGRHGPPPIIAALDADGDGVISSAEIDGAAAALKTLDKNEDGELTIEELRPKRPDHHRDGPAEFAFRPRGPEGPDGRLGPPEGGERDRGDRRRGPGRRGRDREGRGGPPSPERFIEFIMKGDTDGDGRISSEEAPERLQRAFDRIDANGDGFIDRSELEEAAKRFGRRRGSRGEDGPTRGRPGKEKRPPLEEETEA